VQGETVENLTLPQVGLAAADPMPSLRCQSDDRCAHHAPALAACLGGTVLHCTFSSLPMADLSADCVDCMARPCWLPACPCIQLTEQLKTRPVTLTFKYHVSTKKIEGGVMVASGMNRWMNRAKASGGGDKSEAGALGSGLGGEADAADAASAEVTVKFYDQKIGLVMGEYQHLDGHKYMSVEGKRAGSEAEGKHEVKIGMLLKEVAGQTMAGRAMHEITEILARSERPLSITLMDMERQRGGGGEAVGKVSAELVQCRAKLKAVEEDGARVLEHMYHMEDQLATAQAENDRLQQEVTQHKESLRLLDQSQAELQAMYDGVNSELHMERRKGERITDENLQIRDRLARLADQYVGWFVPLKPSISAAIVVSAAHHECFSACWCRDVPPRLCTSTHY
jgi:hypothetical protein